MAVRTAEAGYGVYDTSAADFEVEGMKLILEQMAEACGTDLLYHAFASDMVVENGKVVGAVIQSKSGREVIHAGVTVDCTGDGDGAALAGCAYDLGDEETGLCQPMTLMFTIGGVDWERVRAFRGNDYKLTEVWKRAQAAGDMRPFQNQVMGWWWTPTRPDQVGVNFTHVNFADATNVRDLTRATLESRKQAFETIAVYRRYVPGMENCHMVSTPATIGTRESRRIRGLHRLTRNEILAQTAFPDAIGWGSFFIDIHNTKGPGMDEKTHRPPKGFKYQIPYRILTPKDVDNLLVAGRCASCDHEALGSLRVMPQCGVMGQAAGAAAALAVKSGTTPREADLETLRKTLREQGCLIDEQDIARAAEHDARQKPTETYRR
jgi:hypothetical protein